MRINITADEKTFEIDSLLWLLRKLTELTNGNPFDCVESGYQQALEVISKLDIGENKVVIKGRKFTISISEVITERTKQLIVLENVTPESFNYYASFYSRNGYEVKSCKFIAETESPESYYSVVFLKGIGG